MGTLCNNHTGLKPSTHDLGQITMSGGGTSHSMRSDGYSGRYQALRPLDA
jgi:hypothetical protein